MLVRVLTGHEKRNLDFEALTPGMEVSFGKMRLSPSTSKRWNVGTSIPSHPSRNI